MIRQRWQPGNNNECIERVNNSIASIVEHAVHAPLYAALVSHFIWALWNEKQPREREIISLNVNLFNENVFERTHEPIPNEMTPKRTFVHLPDTRITQKQKNYNPTAGADAGWTRPHHTNTNRDNLILQCKFPTHNNNNNIIRLCVTAAALSLLVASVGVCARFNFLIRKTIRWHAGGGFMHCTNCSTFTMHRAHCKHTHTQHRILYSKINWAEWSAHRIGTSSSQWNKTQMRQPRNWQSSMTFGSSFVCCVALRNFKLYAIECNVLSINCKSGNHTQTRDSWQRFGILWKICTIKSTKWASPMQNWSARLIFICIKTTAATCRPRNIAKDDSTFMVPVVHMNMKWTGWKNVP